MSERHINCWLMTRLITVMKMTEKMKEYYIREFRLGIECGR